MTKFDFSDISFMDFQAQGGQDWGIDNIFAVSVPEPGTAALMFAGLGLIGWFGAHRRAQVRTHSRADRPTQPSSDSCGRP